MAHLNSSRSRRLRYTERDRGSITGFVLVITMAVICCAGLVIDGGRIVGAKVSASDHAENAARVGAQQVVSLRAGQWVLDAARAKRNAEAYLVAHGVDGSVAVNANRVTVTVQSTVSTTLLRLVGVVTKSVHATRFAQPVTH